MTLQTAKRTFAFALVSFIVVAKGFAHNSTPSEIPIPPSRLSRRVVVSIRDKKLAVLEGGKVVETFAVAVGAAVSPSPSGRFEIVRRLKSPTYYHPGVIVPAGTNNPLGPRWVGLSQKGYGIHGTNEPRSIGKAASHGCIRMRNSDIVRFFEMVRVGDVVEIHGERDSEMAEIFGADGVVAQTTVSVLGAAEGAH